MRGLVSLESSGLKEFIAEMEGFVEAFPECSELALKAQEDFLIEKIKQNYVSMVPGAKVGDFIYSSIGKSTELSKLNTYSVVGTVGVYKLDKVEKQFGKTEKDFNAPQLAYWIEYGTTLLKSGEKKKTGLIYPEGDVKLKDAAIPFMSNAIYSTIDEQKTVFINAFWKNIDQFSYSGA